LSLARNKKTAQSVRKHFAEVRVRHCEETLQALQQELQEFRQEIVSIDNELQETESNIGQLRNMVLRSRQVKGVTDGIALHTPHKFYGSASDSSVESIPSKAPDDQY
jgi:FtsZ-binding cell division protein ZapB